jgi:large subunit ribosomal protein L5
MAAPKKTEKDATPQPTVEAPALPRLKERYQQEMVPKLMARFGYRQVMEVPRLSKIVVSMGVGAATQDPKILESAMGDLAIVTGQKPASSPR